jgi:hypothetical protein
MKKVLIHQPYKYGDYINLIGMAQKLMSIDFEVYFPYSYGTKDIADYLEGIISFEIGPLDLNFSKRYCIENEILLINCQYTDDYNHLCTINDGPLFIEELKYYIAEDIVKSGIQYKDKYNFTWNRNLAKEKSLKDLIGIKNGDTYNISHLVGDNGRKGQIPEKFKNDKTIEIRKIEGYSLLDWYDIILNAKNIFTIQSSVQCFVDCFKNNLNHDNLFLLNDNCETNRLLVPAYDWNMSFFNKKTLK